MKKTPRRRISKYSGAGNTFLITTREPNSKLPASNQVKKICKKVKSDGLLLLDSIGKNKFKWHFFNEDGSTAEMCGNALRCVGMYCSNELKSGPRIEVRTGSGKVFCEKRKGQFLAQMPQVGKVSWVEKLKGYFVNTGVPHFVIQTKMKRFSQAQKNRNWLRQAKKIRHMKELFSQGTNVTLLLDTRSKKAITFERGVEGYTPACGTGAVAAAAVYFLKDKKKLQVIEMPGGKLIVKIGPRIILGGPTKKIRSYSEKEIKI